VTQHGEWVKDEVVPLVSKSLASNILTLSNGFAYAMLESWYAVCELDGNTCNEFLGATNFSTTSREEETSP
jgi:hypothetical protein